MDWKNPVFVCKLVFKEALMGALRKTGQSLSKLLSACDSSAFRYSEPKRHEKFMERVDLGPLIDALHLQADLTGAIKKWETERQNKNSKK